MAQDLEKGDAVEWHASQGAIEGRVEEKLTAPIDFKGHHVAASKDDPQYLVKSDATGAEAAHRPESVNERD